MKQRVVPAQDHPSRSFQRIVVRYKTCGSFVSFWYDGSDEVFENEFARGFVLEEVAKSESKLATCGVRGIVDHEKNRLPEPPRFFERLFDGSEWRGIEQARRAGINGGSLWLQPKV